MTVRKRGLTLYGKVFASMFQGTLRGRPHDILVFANLIATADSDGVVDRHPEAIAGDIGLDAEEVRAALRRLEAPDPESRSPDENGRRIMRLDEHRSWGWRLVNYGYYRALRSTEERRLQNREAQRRRRARIADSQQRQQCQPKSAQEEEEAEAYQSVSHPSGSKHRPPRKRGSLSPAQEDDITWAIEHCAELTGRRLLPDAECHHKPLRGLIRSGEFSREAWQAVVAWKWREWREKPEFRRRVVPETLARPSNWPRYCEEAIEWQQATARTTG